MKMLTSSATLSALLLSAALAAILLMGCESGATSSNGDSHLPALTSAEEFDAKVLKADTPVMVDFYATWCPPCRTLAPILEKLAPEFEGKVAIVKVDVDKAGELAASYGIRSIPTLVFFKNGEEVDRSVGAPPEGELRKRLADLAKQ